MQEKYFKIWNVNWHKSSEIQIVPIETVKSETTGNTYSSLHSKTKY